MRHRVLRNDAAINRRSAPAVSVGASLKSLLVRREFSDIWVMTLSGMGGVLNDTISIYFVDAALVTAFVARSCVAGP